jgi:hypothetical protein
LSLSRRWIVSVAGTAGLLLTVLAPTAQGATEDLVTVSGHVEQVVIDAAPGHPDAGPMRTLPFINIDGRLLAAPAGRLQGARTGQRVTATLRSRPGLTSAESVLRAATATKPSTGTDDLVVDVELGLRAASVPTAKSMIGVHNLTVLPVYWSAKDSATLESLTAMAGRTRDYWAQQSDGRIDVRPTVRDWQHITDPGSCDPDTLYNKAIAAHGITPAADEHVLVYFPTRSDCGGWAGLASVSGTQAWVNGYQLIDVFAHEFGHNLGLGHANATTCTSDGVRVPLSDTCTVEEYQDSADVMGYALNQDTGNLNTAFADFLGLAQVVTASTTATTTVTLAPLAQVEAVRAVKIPVPGGDVFVDFRPAQGRDVRRTAWAGVQVHLRRNTWSPSTELLDLQPEQESFSAVSLPPSARWVVPGTKLAVKVISVGSTGAEVSVEAADSGPVTVTAPSDGTICVLPLTVTWAMTEPAPAAVVVDGLVAASVDAGTTSATLVSLPDGVHHLTVQSLNPATGLPVATAAEIEVTTDTTGPSRPVITAPGKGAVLGKRTTSVSWSAAADDGSGISAYQVSNGRSYVVADGDSHRATLTLAEGVNTLSVTAVNGAGLSKTGPARRVTVDSRAPAAPTRAKLAASGKRLSWTAPSDSGTALRYRLSIDGHHATTVTAPRANLALSRGRHTFSVVAVDRAGNTSARLKVVRRVS